MSEQTPLNPDQVASENMKLNQESARLERVIQNSHEFEAEGFFEDDDNFIEEPDFGGFSPVDTVEEATAVAARHSKRVLEFVDQHRDVLHEQALVEDAVREAAKSEAQNIPPEQ